MNLALSAMSGLLATSQFGYEAMKAAADVPTSAATDLAEFLVVKGVPFRDAHAIVGALVRESLESGTSLRDLVEDHGDLGIEALHLLQEGVSVTRRTTAGGAGPEPVGPQLLQFTAKLEHDWACVRKD